MEEDRQHLRLLSIFHYVYGGLMGLSGCVPVLFLVFPMGLFGAMAADGEEGAAVVGALFVCLFWTAICLTFGIAIAILVAGSKLAGHTGYTFCLVVAAVECMFTPVGTVLGVFTIIVLMRPTVKELFGVADNRERGIQDDPGYG